MEEVKRYKIAYTETAERQIIEKANYITWQFGAPDLAEIWYERLRTDIQKGLSTLPNKYQLYDVAPWKEQGIRLYLSRNDIVLYRVDEPNGVVYIEAVFTKGKDLTIESDG